jgi:ABC-type transporter lipoprotein component MlaA
MHFENAIKIIETRNFFENKDKRAILIDQLLDLEYFKAIYKESRFKKHLSE